MKLKQERFSPITTKITLFGSLLLMSLSSLFAIELHPVRDTYSQDVPFYQAVPISKGELNIQGKSLKLWNGREELSAEVTPLAYWADGSVRWLSVEGIWSANTDSKNEWKVREKTNLNRDSLSGWNVKYEEEQEGLNIVNAQGEVVMTLAPEAARMAINSPRAILPEDPEWLDSEGQYTWAQPFEALSSNPEKEMLALTVVDQLLEVQTSEYVQYRIRGKGTSPSGSQDMEWQLRLRIYPSLNLIRSEMTWKVLWDVERYALVSATWKVKTTGEYESVNFTGRDTALKENDEWVLINGVKGISEEWHNKQKTDAYPIPDSARNLWVVSDKETVIGVTIPDFSKKGPSHFSINPHEIEIASWSPLTGKALDLRSSGQPQEFGIADHKLESNGRGFAYTLEASFVFGEQKDEKRIKELLVYEESREGIWFPVAAELEKTAVIEKFSTETIKQNPEYFSGMYANLLFLVRARDGEKWYGVSNYGDFRTNFARGRDIKRGLYPEHWVLYGRYGWRNGSGGVTSGLLKAGLFLEDREITMAAWEHARHIADIDTFHGSFFKPYRRLEGGLHRRNRDHWSGSVQMQYSPTDGLYLMSWLGGNQRVRDALEGIRKFSENDQGVTSAFAAQSWIYRYMETQSQEDYVKARKYLENAANFWEAHGEEFKLKGIAALYAGNFRRASDGLGTLIGFYEATGEREYLNAIEESMLKNKLVKGSVSLDQLAYMAGWLSSQGVVFPRDKKEEILTEVKKLIPAKIFEPKLMSYSELMNITLTLLPPAGSPQYRESNAIAKSGRTSFVMMNYLENSKKEEISEKE